MILAESHFDHATIAPFVDVWETKDASGVPDVQPGIIHYRVTPKERSHDAGYAYRPSNKIRVGQTIWMRGDVLIPSGPLGSRNRKLIDATGGGDRGLHTRVVVHRRDWKLLAAIFDYRDGYTRERYDLDLNAALPDDEIHRLELRISTNTKFTRNDGVLKFYMDGEYGPRYSRTSGLGWITDKYTLDPQGSFLSTFYFGSQLTIDPGDPAFKEFRYWNNLTFSTTRLPR